MKGLGGLRRWVLLPSAGELTPGQRKAVEAFRGKVIHSPQALLSQIPGGVDAAPVHVVGGPALLHAVPYRSGDGKKTLVAMTQDFSWIGEGKQAIPVASGCEIVFHGPPPKRAVEVVTGQELRVIPSGTGSVRISVPDFQSMALVKLEQ